MIDDRYRIVVARPAATTIAEELPEPLAASVIELVTGRCWTIPVGRCTA